MLSSKLLSIFFFLKVFNCVLDGNVFNKGSLEVAMGLHLRLRLFWVKMVSGNHFTPLNLFSKLRKFGQTEIRFRVDRKITLFWHKTISNFILPSNQLHSSHSLEALHKLNS